MTRIASPDLVNYIAAWDQDPPTQIVDLYIFTLNTGEVFHYTSSQIPILAPMPGVNTPLYTFTKGPKFGRTKLKSRVGVQIDELQVDVFAGQNDFLGFNAGGTLTWQEAIFYGLFDGAFCTVLKAYVKVGRPGGALNPEVVGTITWFYGRLADITIGRTRCRFKIRSLLDLLTVQMPRYLIEASCPFVFGGPSCGFNRITGVSATGQQTLYGQVTVGSGTGTTQQVLYANFTPPSPGTYDNGTLIGKTGLNAGFTRAIASVYQGVIYFLKPWVFPVVVNVDYFYVLPGCDQSTTRCNLYQNFARFGGCPDIPPPESAI